MDRPARNPAICNFWMHYTVWMMPTWLSLELEPFSVYGSGSRRFKPLPDRPQYMVSDSKISAELLAFHPVPCMDWPCAKVSFIY